MVEPALTNKIVHHNGEEQFNYCDRKLTEVLDTDPVPQFDALNAKESWFYIRLIEQFRALISDSQTIHEGFWQGPGWYYTSRESGERSSWLSLRDGDVRKVFDDRQHFSILERKRLQAFLEALE